MANTLAESASEDPQHRQQTVQDEAAAQTLRLTRLYNVLIQCNKAIVRCHNEQELFEQICSNVVTVGHMKLALIWLTDEQTGQLKPIASSNSDLAYLSKLQYSVSSNLLYACGPSNTAFLQDQPVWCQDFQNDPTTVIWHDIAVKNNWVASASLPLHKDGKAVGTFSLYADETHAFDEAARNLLIEMATDIDYALTRFELQARQQRLNSMDTLRICLRELITSDMTLHDILAHAARALESVIPESRCAILLLDRDGEHLHVNASPSLPDIYSTMLNGLNTRSGPNASDPAVFASERTIIPDVTNHPHWISLAAFADEIGIVSSWAEPIISATNSVVGNVAIYHRSSWTPDDMDIQFAGIVVRAVASALERKQIETSLRKLSQAVEQSANGIVITDLHANIEYANTAFIANTGYVLSDIIGKNPRFHHSGKTPRSTYDAMWAHLNMGKNWQGEFINLRKDGTEHTDLVRISPIRDNDGQITHYLAIEEDITERKRNDERIQQLAHFDSLTGLPNWTMLDDRAKYALSLAQRNQTSLALMFLDLDHFKNINDAFGHSVGDTLLVEVAKRLRRLLRANDTVARLSGDEFIFLLYGSDEHSAELVAQKLMHAVIQPYALGQYNLNVTASIGIAIYPDDGTDLDTLSKNADTAMYRAKQEGRNNYCFFTQEMQDSSERYLTLVNALRQALENNQMQLYYQPQVTIPEETLVGAEALLRWQHPTLGAISPAEFIPIAESSGQIIAIGEWVLLTAVQQAKQWLDQDLGELVIAVNLSAVQFRHTNLTNLVMHILSEVGLPAEYLELELTEGVAMHDPQGAIAVMNTLHEHGVRMSIDDFGTGYSSLNYLKKFNVYKLKIDQSFVRDITNDIEDKAIVSAIISMAKSLGLQTIAEGVETTEQQAFLCEQGCNEIQGYFYSKPLPATEFTALAHRYREKKKSLPTGTARS